MSRKVILRLKAINKYYRGKIENLHIIRDLDLEVLEGEFITVLGKSGSGKSTLLNLIGLLDKVDDGELYIDNRDISQASDNEKDEIKNTKLGFIFQFHYLLSEFTALENVMLPALLKNYSKKQEVEKRAIKLLEQVGLEERLTHKPSELSGGEKQRVAIARALINSPKILLADEPTGNLDEETSETIHEIFKKINKEMNQTIIVVTHSKELAAISEKSLFLKKGKIEKVQNNHL
ncbi:MAG: ABC transporter ATP-binding protein [Fusobacteriaceae bacterium]